MVRIIFWACILVGVSASAAWFIAGQISLLSVGIGLLMTLMFAIPFAASSIVNKKKQKCSCGDCHCKKE